MKKIISRKTLTATFTTSLVAFSLLFVVGLSNINLAAAQGTVAALALPGRIFDLSKEQFPKLTSDISAEVKLLKSLDSTPDKLRRLRRVFELAVQIKQYKAAMETLGTAVNNKIYDAISISESELNRKGITSEMIALEGLRAINTGDWSKLNQLEMENFEVTSAVFLSGISNPASAAKAQLDLGNLYAGLGKNTISFDRFRDSVELVKLIEDENAKAEIEINLASTITKITDQRRFGLLTLLVQSNTRDQQQKIIETVAENWSEPTTAVDPIAAVWKKRIENLKAPISDETLIAQLQSHAAAIDTNLSLVLLAGSIGTDHSASVHTVILDYLKQGKGLKALELLSDLPTDEVNAQSYIAVITHFSDRDHATIVGNIAAALEEKIKSTNAILTNQEQSELAVALARAGQTALLRQYFDQKILGVDTLDQERILSLAQLNSALNILGQSQTVQPLEIRDTQPDLKLLAQLFQGLPAEVPQDLNIDPKVDLGVWVRSGQLLWTKMTKHAGLIEFEKSPAPNVLKLALARGVTASNSFDPEIEDGAIFSKAIIENKILQKTNGPRTIDAILVAASLGQKNEDKDDLNALTTQTHLLSEYNERQANFAVTQSINMSFQEQTAQLKQIPDYATRVSAFRRLALVRANKLDTAKWLNASSSQATDLSNEATPAIVQTDGTSDISNNFVSIKSTNDSFLLEAAKRPHMPDYYPTTSDVYSVLPMPLDGQANATIGGESRIDRLTRFASEHYEDVTNLGVREHIYNSTGSITPRFMFVRSGVLSLGQLLQKIGHFNPELISEEDGDIILKAPLVVGPDATLVLSGEEFKQLRLSQQKGAFIINAGKIYFSDIEVVGFDETTGKPATIPVGNPGIKFRPFILSWSASQTFAANSKFEALGYSAGSAYGFSLSSGPADEIFDAVHPAAPTGLIVDNSFENLYYGFYAFEAQNARLVGNEYRDGVVYGLDPHDRSRNLLMAYNSAYGTHKKHGIIISREVDDSFIIGNLSFDNAGTGVMLDRESVGTIIYANSLMNNKGDGFAAFESPCALVSNNDVENNHRVGIKVRNSWDIQIEANFVRKNGASGIEAYTDKLEESAESKNRNFKKDPYQPVSTMTVVRNELIENPTAVQTHGVAATTLFNNQFISQAPRLFAGDVRSLALDIFVKSSAHPITVVSNCVPKIVNRKVCKLVQHGFVLGQSTNRDFTGQAVDAGFCFAKMGEAETTPVKKVN